MFIADIGINHNGDVDMAKRLIKFASQLGVDVVKFQKRNPDICVPEEYKHEIKDTIFGKMEYIEYKHKLEFGKAEYDEISKCCKEFGIKWTASVWDEDSLEFINQYDIPFLKIPSAQITNLGLLRKVNKTCRDVMISTGMSNEQQISVAVRNLMFLTTILHCNSSYPCAIDEIDLRYMVGLKQKYASYQIGYSGHEEGYLPTVMAKALGAQVIERHITISKDLKGTDQKASLDIPELGELMIALKKADIILGTDHKVVYDSEYAVMQKLRNF